MKNSGKSSARRSFINRLLAVFSLGGLATSAQAHSKNQPRARMGASLDPFLGEITLFPYNFTPAGWASCEGQLLPISQNTALFSLLGTIYGGDGETTFALPDLRGRAPIGFGSGPGLPSYVIGEKGGTATTTLITANLPNHTHTAIVGGDVKLNVTSDDAHSDEIVDNYLAVTEDMNYATSATAGEHAGALENNITVTNQATGSNVAFNNMPPFLTMRYCIALQGVYPSE